MSESRGSQFALSRSNPFFCSDFFFFFWSGGERKGGEKCGGRGEEGEEERKREKREGRLGKESGEAETHPLPWVQTFTHSDYKSAASQTFAASPLTAIPPHSAALSGFLFISPLSGLVESMALTPQTSLSSPLSHPHRSSLYLAPSSEGFSCT